MSAGINRTTRWYRKPIQSATEEPVTEHRYTSIRRVENHGTIVAVHLAQGAPVYFDHRPFHWLFEARGGWDNIIGARVRRVEDDQGGESIVFEDEEEGLD